jgi:hypothetical protein
MVLACEAIVSTGKAGYKTGIEIGISCAVDTAERNVIVNRVRGRFACEIYKLKVGICKTVSITRVCFSIILEFN